MDLQHTFSVPISIDAAWVAFNDLAGIAPCFPGAVITSVDGDDFTGTAKVKLGPVALQYSGKGQWLSRDESAYRAVIEAVGKDKRGNGTASATITAHLESQGPAETTVVVNTDLRITGRPAQFGRGVIQDVGSKILDQFATCLSERLGQDPVNVGADPNVAADSVDTGADAGSDVPDVGATEPGADPTAPAASPAFDPASSDPAPAESPSVDTASVGTASVGTASFGVPAAAPPSAPAPVAAVRPPTPLRPAPPSEPRELDLGGVVGPVLLKRYGPTALACAITAVITWVVARRR